MKLIFISGPFRADTPWFVEQNVRCAEELALEIWRMGAAVVCPHANTRFFNGSLPDQIWINGYLEILSRCDAVVMIDGWDKSLGAMAELEFARARGILVFYWNNMNSVKDWIKGTEESQETQETQKTQKIQEVQEIQVDDVAIEYRRALEWILQATTHKHIHDRCLQVLRLPLDRTLSIHPSQGSIDASPSRPL